MTVYQSTGTFDPVKETFSITIQTTILNRDKFYISKFYNICDANRYALVGILQTVNGNTTDFSNYPPNKQLIINDFSFKDIDNSYLVPGDKDICNITASDEIIVYIHDGIGFNPVTNVDDNKYIENYKAGIYIHYAAGSPPGCGGNGGLG